MIRRDTRLRAAGTRAGAADRAALHRIRAMMEHGSDAITLLDGSGRRRYVSAGTQRLLGASESRLVGRLDFDRVHPDDLLRQRGVFSRLLEDPGGSLPWECRLRHADGTWRRIEGTATNRLGDPVIAAVVVNFRDVTAREAGATTLQASEMRFRTLWDMAVDAMVLTDARGIVLQVNSAYCDLYGVTPGAAVGQPFSSSFPAQKRARATRRYQEMFGAETAPPTFEATVWRADGTERVIEVHVTFLTQDGRRVAMLSVVRDVTERVRSQVAHDQLAAIVRSSEDAIIGQRLDGTITSWNEGAERLYGYPASEALGQSMDLIIPPQRRREMSDLVVRIGRGERIARLETVRQLKNGQAVPVALTVSPILGADGAISGVSAIARDISERLRVQAELLSTNQQLRVALVELALSRTRLHDLFTQAPAIIATVRGPAHVFELVNPDFVQLVGRVGAAELVGQSVGEALPELVSQGFLEIVDRVYATGEPFVGTEVPLQFRGGDGDALEDHFLTFVVQPSRGATGAVDGLLLFATEVTGQVRTQQQMIQQERLRALGEMASGIVHDFNNVLTPVVGFSELLLKVPGTIDDPVKARQYVEMIFTSAKDAAAVVSRLGEFSRPRDEGEILEPVDLAPLVEQVIRLTQPRWRDQALASGQTVQVKMKRRLSPPVAGRAPELREILTNLLFNAVDAMPTGGTITVSVRPEPRGYTPSSGAIAGAGSRRAGVLLSVHDTGTGMSEETRRRCLEPFYTTKGHRGTGLGLAMVYGIVRRMSGDLTIESAPGRGTTITIRLPAYLASPAPEATAPPPTPPPLRVLVVDDEPVVQQVTMAYLVAEGHRPTAVGGGREALECLDAGGTDAFDVVITDGAMPGMNGDELALAIKERAPRLPVILLTGFGGLIGPSGVPGVDTVLSKPINLAALRQALDGLVGPPTEAR